MRLIFLLSILSTLSFAQSVDPFAKVNSPLDEQNPILSPDGETLYLSVANHPQNAGGKKDPGDIWMSSKEADGWSAPVHGGSLLNNAAFNGVAGISKDGKTLYLLSHYRADGSSPATQGISISRKTNTGWSAPRNISIPYFLNRATTLGGFWLEDQSVIVFSAESHNTMGAEDIYVSFNQEGKWTELLNLGNVVNTPFQEMSPSLSVDGTKLYFSSNGRKDGQGSFDIYVSNRLDASWTLWSEPVNIGPRINSEDRELYYKDFARFGFSLYTSTHSSDGYGDIRILTDSLIAKPVEEIKIQPLEETPPAIEDKSLKISGRVTNSKSGEGIAARLVFRSDSAVSALASKEGSYSLGLQRAKAYIIEVGAPGFVNLSEKLDIQSINPGNLEMNFKLQPIEVGAVVNLKNVLFELGTVTLLQESYPELNGVVEFLKSNPKVEIVLEGHTDNRGDMKKNLALSQERVDAIKSYLVSKGISSKRIKGKGFGGTRPIATNNSEEARALNRRVEFRILKD